MKNDFHIRNDWDTVVRPNFVIIYYLNDPEDNTTHFVGYMPSGTTRLKLIDDINRVPQRAALGWVAGLMRRGLAPDIIPLEDVPAHQAAEVRNYWVEYLSAKGIELLNV